MGIVFRKFKRSFKKSVSLAVFAALVIVAFLFKDFILTQFNHVIAFYYVYQGDDAYKKAKLQDAIDNYNLALNLFPEHVKAQYNLGNIYAAYEDFNSAITCYNKALNVNPNYVSARINLGIILAQELVELDSAIDEYKKAINTKLMKINIPYIFNNSEWITQNTASAYYNLGLAYKAKSVMLNQEPNKARLFLEKAANSYRKSIQYISSSYDAHYNLALTDQLLGNYTEALEEYCRAITIDPLSYESHYNMALLLKQKMDYKESLSELEKAGLILDSRGDSFKTRYIYQVLSEISQRAIAAKENSYIHLAENIDNKPVKADTELTYINGKVVATEKLEKAIYENMKTCSVCNFITEEEKK